MAADRPWGPAHASPGPAGAPLSALEAGLQSPEGRARVCPVLPLSSVRGRGLGLTRARGVSAQLSATPRQTERRAPLCAPLSQ